MLGRRSSIVYSNSKTYLCHNRPRPSRHFEKLGLVNVSLSLLQTRLHPPLLNDQAIWENGLEPVLKKDNMINIDISTLKKKLTDSNPWASLCCTGRPPNRLSSSTACGGNRLWENKAPTDEHSYSLFCQWPLSRSFRMRKHASNQIKCSHNYNLYFSNCLLGR